MITENLSEVEIAIWHPSNNKSKFSVQVRISENNKIFYRSVIKVLKHKMLLS